VVSRLRVRIVFAICLCLAGAVVSGVLLGQHYGESWATSTVKSACGDAQTSGCEQVAQSEWSSFLGIPLAAYGLVFYFSLLILFILALFASSGLRDSLAGIATILLVFGLLIDLSLLGVQAFAIHAYCKLCILTYVLSACSFIVLFPACKFARNIIEAARASEGRLALVGWILGTLIAISSVFGFDAMLHARDLYRQATMLFEPSSSPSITTPVPAGSTPKTTESPAKSTIPTSKYP
jgi:uncharacterized membrane protein